MFDELEAFRNSPDLQRLLDHYVQLCADDRELWQDRRMEMEEVEPRALVKLHGLLIAFGWLEQNAGQIPVIRAGAVPSCYRVTAAGVRTAKMVRNGVPEEAEALVSSREDHAAPQQHSGVDQVGKVVVMEAIGSVG